jgi:oligopeptide transport system substrate-binding protein
VADQLRDGLGVAVEVEPNGFTERFVRIRDADYQLAIVAWKADYDDALGLLLEHTSDGAAGNQSKWSDERYNAIMARARVEPDTGERRKLLVEAEALLLGHAAVQPLLYRGRYWAVRRGVHGLVHVPVGPSPELRWARRDFAATVT